MRPTYGLRCDVSAGTSVGSVAIVMTTRSAPPVGGQGDARGLRSPGGGRVRAATALLPAALASHARVHPVEPRGGVCGHAARARAAQSGDRERHEGRAPAPLDLE